MITWEHPWVLLFLLPLLALLLWRVFRRPAAVAFPAPGRVLPNPSSITRTFRPGRHHLFLFLNALAATSLIVALARPQRSLEVLPAEREGTDIVIVLDYSNSMDAWDPPPELDEDTVRERIKSGELLDRLAVARQQIARFINRRPGDRLGLVIFGHQAYPSCPPTLDHDFLLGQVDLLENSLLGEHERGTCLAAGVATGIRLLEDAEANTGRDRTIVLITDGANTVADPEFTPVEAAELARDRNITVHTVGIGSDTPYVPRHLRQAMQGGSYDTSALREIADTADGQFFRPMDNDGFEKVMTIIDRLETTSELHEAVIFRRDLFPFFLKLAFLALLASFLLQNTVLFAVP